MPNDDRISIGETLLWGALGAVGGLVAGVALSEWVGGVNQPRLRRVASRIQRGTACGASSATPTAPTAAGGARAARAALLDHPTLRALDLQAVAVSRTTVELRGWVASRATRALAARVIRGVPGIDVVINNILVRGEDDLLVVSGTPDDLLA